MNFHGEKRSNDTHQLTTDPDARLYTKGGVFTFGLAAYNLVRIRNLTPAVA